LQMVLFGQPELDEKLLLPQIRQLKERITHSFNLSPFPPDDTLQYLNFRLRAVGYKGPDVFNKKTAGVVKKYSGGLTRRINILADKAMLAAFSEGTHSVTPSHVKSAAIDSEFKKNFQVKNIVIVSALVLLVAAVLLAGIYIGKQGVSNNAVESVSSSEPVFQPRNMVVSAEDKAIAVPVIRSQKIVAGSISERVSQTRQWLSAAIASHYSIQLFMARTSDADKVEAFLSGAHETLDFTKIYIYETVINGRAWYSVLYNDFATQDDAIAKLNALPASLKASDPYLRRISALKKDIAKQGGESQ